MNTDADKNILKAKEEIHEAILSLSLVVVDECDGTDLFKREYLDMLANTLNDLLEIRARMRYGCTPFTTAK